MNRSLCRLMIALVLFAPGLTGWLPSPASLLAPPVHAQTTVEKISGYCERGGQKVSTAGQTSTTTVQKSYPSCTVTVYQTGTSTLQTIYSTSGLAAKSNPFTADANGYFEFYSSVTQRLDIQLSGGTAPNNISTPFFWRSNYNPGGATITLSNQGTALSPQRIKLNLEWPFLVATDDSTNSASNINIARTPTGPYNAILDIGMSGDPRLWSTTAIIPAGATTVTLTGSIIDDSLYPEKYRNSPLTHTFKVGQGIRIPRGGDSCCDYVGVVTAISGNVLTFSPATTTSSVDVNFISHDETKALTDFITAHPNGGTVQFPDGGYQFSSYYSYTSGKDYAISIPLNSEGTNQQWQFVGSGKFRSMLLHSGPGHLFRLSGTTTINTKWQGLYMAHVSRYSNQALAITTTGNYAGAALYLQSNQYTGSVPNSGATGILVDDCMILGWRDGIMSDNMQSSKISNTSFYYNANAVSLISTGSVAGIGSQTEPNANILDNLFIQYGQPISGDMRTGTGGALSAASTSLVCTTCSFTSSDLYKVVKIPGAGINGTDQYVTLIAITSATSATVSQPAWTSVTGQTVTIFQASRGHIFANNANGLAINGGTFQGSWSSPGTLANHGIWILNAGAKISDLHIEDVGGTGGASIKLQNSNNTRILNSSFKGDNPGGYGVGLYLDNVRGLEVSGCFIGQSGLSQDIVALNGTRGVKFENSTIASASSAFGSTTDTSQNFWPFQFGQGMRYLNSSESGGMTGTELLNDSTYSRQLLVNGNFAGAGTGWTLTAPGALTFTAGSPTIRGSRYVQVAPTTGGGNSYSEQLAQTISIDNSIQSLTPVTVGFDWYIASRGVDAIASPPTYNELRVKLIFSGGDTIQESLDPSAATGRIATRWNRVSITGRIPSGTSRTVKVQIEAGQGANAAVFRLANFRLTYGTRATFDDDEPVTELGSNYIDATAYGMKCDNSTNDTTALNNAQTAARAQNKSLRLPAGVCRITQFVLKDFDHITGAGIDRTTLRGTANNAIVTVSTQADYATLEKLTIQGDTTLASQVGLDLGGNADYPGLAIRDVYIKDTGSHGFSLGNEPFSVDFNNIHVSNTIGYPILIDTPYAPGIVFRNTYVHVLNAASPLVGIRVKNGRVRFDNVNGLDNAPPIAGTRWAVIGKRNGVDGETTDADAYVVWNKANFEQFEAVGVEHYFNSKSTFEDCTFSYGGTNVNRIALKYDIDTASGYTYAAYHNKGVIDDKTSFGNAETDYKNSSYIHATGVPPLMTAGQGATALAVAYDNVNQYYDTTLSQRVPLMRSDGFEQPITVTGSTSLIRPVYGIVFANCAAPCTLTLANPLWYKTTRELIIRDISNNASVNNVTLQVDGGSTIDGAGTYVLNTNNGTVRLMPRLTGTDWKTVAGSGGGGGGGVTSVSASSPLGSSGGATPNISISSTIPVANGGTGQASLTSNGVLYGMGTSAIGQTSAGAVNSVLASAGAAPSFTTAPTISSVSLVSNTNQIALGTGNTSTVTMAALTGARVFTLPDADSNPVQPSAAVSNQFLTAISAAGVISRAQPSAANLSNGVTGSGAVVLATSPTLTTPIIADYTNANHTHQSVAQGGTLDAAALASGTLTRARGGTGTAAATTDGQLLIGNTSTGNWSVNTITAGSNVTVTNGPGTITISASSSAGSRWDQLSNPTANLTLAMGSFTTAIGYGAATGSSNLWSMSDTVSNTGTGYVFSVNTAASSAAKPVSFTAGGTSNGVEMNTSGVLVALGTGGVSGAAISTGSIANARLDSDLTAIGDNSTNGIYVRTGAGTLSVTAPGTGVLTALAVNTGSTGAFVLNGGIASAQVAFGNAAGSVIGSADFVYGTSGGTLDINKTVNSTMYMAVTNNSAGAAATARLAVASDNAGGGLYSTSLAYTPSAGIVGDAVVLDMDGVAILKGRSGSSMRFLLGATEYVRLDATGLALGTSTTDGKLRIVGDANDEAIKVTHTAGLTGANAQSLIDLAQTWNTTGAPIALKLNITNTASDAASLLMDLQVGGVSQAKISKAGVLTVNSCVGCGGGGSGTVSSGTTNQFAYYTGATTVSSGAEIIRNTTNIVSFNAAWGLRRTATATSYTVLVTDHIVGVTSTAAARTITLPDGATAAAAVTSGTVPEYTIIDESNGAATNNITITRAGSDTFLGGATSVVIDLNAGSVTIYWNGTTWQVK